MDGHPGPQGLDRIPLTGRLTVNRRIRRRRSSKPPRGVDLRIGPAAGRSPPQLCDLGLEASERLGHAGTDGIWAISRCRCAGSPDPPVPACEQFYGSGRAIPMGPIALHVLHPGLRTLGPVDAQGPGKGQPGPWRSESAFRPIPVIAGRRAHRARPGQKKAMTVNTMSADMYAAMVMTTQSGTSAKVFRSNASRESRPLIAPPTKKAMAKIP
jgi:hypothetical protein